MVKSITPSAAIIEELIYLIRGHKVMLDKDLAKLYGVDTRALIQAVKRNSERFPEDFCFQLSNQEFTGLRSQFVISNRGGRRVAPYVFTEQGVAMLSGVLHSSAAIRANVEIMRTFVRLRSLDAIRQIMAPAEPVKKRRIGFGSDQET